MQRGCGATFAAAPRPTREIARELDLDAVLEATVFRSGEVMRINLQFSDPEKGTRYELKIGTRRFDPQ